MGLADLHIHTIYSYDASSSIPAVLRQAKHRGLDVISITDHDEITGSLRGFDLAPSYGIEALPGMEISTAEGDLLAFNITKKIPRGLSLIETVLKAGEMGGFYIAPHPMAGGLGIKSLKASSILTALKNTEVASILIGIETYNATALDRISKQYASVLADYLGIAQTGSSDAHMAEAVGLGATEFRGQTAADLIASLRAGKTRIHKIKEWNSTRIVGTWAANYVLSGFTRIVNAV